MNKLKQLWATAVLMVLGTATAFAQNGVTGLNTATSSLKTYVDPVTNIALVIGGMLVLSGPSGFIPNGIPGTRILTRNLWDGAVHAYSS